MPVILQSQTPNWAEIVDRALAWFSELAEGRASSLEELGRREGLSGRYLGALVHGS